ncbi:MbcA/ParS/Xre antitoxin family protein [Azospirillum argentinense]|uniref:MbcA/ParS/Xre antitoxin family protein n=1 Tax=Azospirillum argentinense TaxID=2970906 RepID=UPI0015863DFB|nr:MbcA/ParS/Xre antitoxin family protein [Azospirillum argentinense]
MSTSDEPVMAVVRMTASIWHDDADAQAWLTAPHPDLGGQRPLDVAEDEGGARLVLRLLDRMIHGLPA